MKLPLILFFLGASITNYPQQKLSITSSRANSYCNGTCTLIDAPDLNGNPTAVLFVKHGEANGINLDPHPICAYYNSKQWSIMNTDNSTVPEGSKFTVEYFTKPDDTHFTHVVTRDNLVKEKSYIDHAGLNENPAAVFELFQNVSPNIRGGNVNKEDIKTAYDNSVNKWYITNSSNKILDLATGYNISVSPGRGSTAAPITIANSSNNPAITSLAPALFTPGSQTDNTGERVFMTVVGKTQGTFPGENGTTKVELSSFEMESISPRDLASGQTSGKRQHLPVIVQKPSGPGSGQFYKAFTTNELLTSVTFEIYKPGTGAGLILDFKIVLGNAAINNFKQAYTEGQKGFMDQVKFVFQTSEMTISGITVSDAWPSTN